MGKKDEKRIETHTDDLRDATEIITDLQRTLAAVCEAFPDKQKLAKIIEDPGNRVAFPFLIKKGSRPIRLTLRLSQSSYRKLELLTRTHAARYSEREWHRTDIVEKAIDLLFQKHGSPANFSTKKQSA